MARKGGTKVRTGCLTCKGRKVKCDETKLSCYQCLKTGRSCEGYGRPQTKSLRYSPFWQLSRYLFHRTSSPAEGRALQFFCEVAAPTLPGTTDPYFWTHIVLQFGNFEPAVRHSIIVISALYEKRQVHGVSGAKLQTNEFALWHYNNAIQEIKETGNQPLVLLVCVLFICIEFLQSNQHLAIQHCRHGIQILEQLTTTYGWIQEYIVPIFRRLSFLPIFVGDRGSLDFPDLSISGEDCPNSFPTYESAYHITYALLSRAMRLARNGNNFRLETSRCEPTPKELLEEQKVVQDLLDQWHVAFAGLATTLETHDSVNTTIIEGLGVAFSQKALGYYLSIIHDVSRIWADTAFATCEMDYDSYLDVFKRILRQTESLISSTIGCGQSRLKTAEFLFKMGFPSLLYFVAVKCRCLETRILALEMQMMAIPYKGLWDLRATVAISRCLIEIEHGIRLNNTGKATTTPRYRGLPPEAARVRGIWRVSGPSKKYNTSGYVTPGRTISFSLMGTNGINSLQTEFLPDDLNVVH